MRHQPRRGRYGIAVRSGWYWVVGYGPHGLVAVRSDIRYGGDEDEIVAPEGSQ